MILTEENISRILERHLSDESIKGYAIRINGKTFKTDAGKILWKRKNHAMAALRMTLEFKLKRAVMTKLHNQGHTLAEIYGDSEYIRAYDNFLRYLEDNYLIQIIEIE